MISIGDLKAYPGQNVSGNIQIHMQAPAGGDTSNATTSISAIASASASTTRTTTSTDIPITIINGIEEGPTVVVLSGIHGSEYIPILTSQPLLAKTLNNSAELKLNNGALILIHIANLPAYLGRTIYTSPADDQNLNHVFPGKSNGTLSEQIAYVCVSGACISLG